MSDFYKQYISFSILLLNAIISVSLYYTKSDVNGFYFLLSFGSFAAVIYLSFDSILYTSRQFFLGVIGHLAAAVKVLDANARFGYHLINSQTLEIASIMLYTTNLALLFSFLGFYVGERIPTRERVTMKNENVTFFKITLFCLIIVAMILDAVHGQNIITGAGYAADGQEKLSVSINNLNTIGITLSYFVFILALKLNGNSLLTDRYKKLVLFVFIYLYFYVDLLHGVRMDALNGMFGLYLIYRIASGFKANVSFKNLSIVCVCFLLIQIIGTVRSNIDSLSIDTINVVFNNLSAGSSSGIMFYQGTLNDIATTFSGIIYLINQVGFEHLLGSSYVDWIGRTPPAFLYPDRPKDLAWIFYDSGFTSGGGFFELSEAYYNFGFIGGAIVPFLISFLMASGLKLYKMNPLSVFHSLLLAGFLSTFLRGALYQSFAYYKAIVTVYLLYFLLLLISRVFENKGYR